MSTTGRTMSLTLVVSLLASSALAATFYVRTDGGSDQQCTGTVDAAYPGSGTGQPCAWDHPFRALPPDGTPRIVGAQWSSGCRVAPELWGTERADFIVDLTGSSNVEIRCLEITDHSGC